ncbi:MAG: EamA family transporter [Thermoprotei archaeon]|nr:MAG: EamA family transporter [Thermoprotei archaeon]
MKEIGVAAAATAAILWALNPALIKIGAERLDALLFNALRVLASLPLLAGLAVYRRVNMPQNPVVWLYILIATVIGVGIGDLLYIIATKHIGGGRAVTISYTYIFVSQGLATLTLGEEVTNRLVLGSSIALIGIWLVAKEGDKNGNTLKGCAAALGAALAWGIGSIVNKMALKYIDALELAFLRMLVLTLILSPVYIRHLRSLGDRLALIISIVSGVLSFSIALPLFLFAIDVVGVAVTVLVTALTPVLGRVFAHIMAKEAVTVRGISGTLLTAVGIVLGIS